MGTWISKQWVRFSRPSQGQGTMRLALSALALLIVIPGLLVFLTFREHVQGQELVLLLALVLASLGFVLLLSILRAFTSMQQGIEEAARGETDTIEVPGAPTQLREMSEIIGSLNKLTSEFRENGKQLQTFIRQFATLAELTEVTARVPNIHELLDTVLVRAMSATHSRRGTMMLLRDGEDVLDIVSTGGWMPSDPAPIKVHETMARKVIETGDPLLIENIAGGDDPRENDTSRYSSPSCLIMPLKTKTRVLGAMCLSEKTHGEAFTHEDRQFLTVMLGQIGFAVENATLLRKARESARELKRQVANQELQIQDAQGRVAKAEKLAALGQLAGGVAHDFNNMLQAILGYTKLARRGMNGSGPTSGYLEEVRKAADRASQLTSQLLAFGRRQVLNPVDLDLNQVIVDITAMLRRVLGEQVELRVRKADDLYNVHADPRQIEQVLMNLCINARDAMVDGGRIDVVTRNIKLDDREPRRHPDLKRGGYVELSVSDQGCGMCPETINQIFEPFFTTKEVGRGTGLGLATVYGIVQQHNGSIEVDSIEGEGTVFRVLLPASERYATPPANHPEMERPARGGTETVFVAEDEGTVRRLVVDVLERAGYRVVAARDGDEALTMFDAHAHGIDVALLDAVMPGNTGREVYEYMRSQGARFPVLFCSGYAADALCLDESFPDG